MPISCACCNNEEACALPRCNARLDCQLAEVAAGHIAAGTRIFLDDSPFAVALVAALHDKPCTLISPSLRVLHQLQAAALPHEILCPGGGLDKESGMILFMGVVNEAD